MYLRGVVVALLKIPWKARIALRSPYLSVCKPLHLSLQPLTHFLPPLTTDRIKHLCMHAFVAKLICY
jgi:hypothetical protein